MTPRKLVPDKGNDNTPKKELPKTGDGLNPSTIAGIIVLVGGGLIILGIRKNRESRNLRERNKR